MRGTGGTRVSVLSLSSLKPSLVCDISWERVPSVESTHIEHLRAIMYLSCIQSYVAPKLPSCQQPSCQQHFNVASLILRLVNYLMNLFSVLKSRLLYLNSLKMQGVYSLYYST